MALDVPALNKARQSAGIVSTIKLYFLQVSQTIKFWRNLQWTDDVPQRKMTDKISRNLAALWVITPVNKGTNCNLSGKQCVGHTIVYHKDSKFVGTEHNGKDKALIRFMNSPKTPHTSPSWKLLDVCYEYYIRYWSLCKKTSLDKMYPSQTLSLHYRCVLNFFRKLKKQTKKNNNLL